MTLVSALEPEARRLIEELDAYQAPLYPQDSNHLLAPEALAAPEIRFFLARVDGVPAGCGALRVDREGWGEVKRMFVSPRARGKGLGRLILARIEEQARVEKLELLRLETGVRQAEAVGLYRAAGFVERGPFGGYRPDPLSVFMEKALS